jgi:hypothetical protein
LVSYKTIGVAFGNWGMFELPFLNGFEYHPGLPKQSVMLLQLEK